MQSIEVISTLCCDQLCYNNDIYILFNVNGNILAFKSYFIVEILKYSQETRRDLPLTVTLFNDNQHSAHVVSATPPLFS